MKKRYIPIIIIAALVVVVASIIISRNFRQRKLAENEINIETSEDNNTNKIDNTGCAKEPGNTDDQGNADDQDNADDPAKKTLSSLEKLGDNLYRMDNYTDYKMDEFLSANINDVDKFDAWLTDNLTGGVPTSSDRNYGCSCFTTKDSDGNTLYARNYDEDNTGSLVLRNYPEDGYASIGIVDLYHLNLGPSCDYAMDSPEADSLLMATPFGICDGMNEKGLAVSVLSLDDPIVVNDSAKGDLLLYACPRVLLDKCANVDEAVAFLSEYDMYSPSPRHSYHLFIGDNTGKSVIVEWIDGQMHVVDGNMVANFILYGVEDTLPYDYDHRYLTMQNQLKEHPAYTIPEAMDLLSMLKQLGYSRWSAIYNLDTLSLDVCFDSDFETTYSFTLFENN
ncbi:MAG: linear amide C-N hydrolase [Lachnospiraceae bacterium]|nr:linear amide C-N hydrolase [Lachnospiraceae bacterium]